MLLVKPDSTYGVVVGLALYNRDGRTFVLPSSTKNKLVYGPISPILLATSLTLQLLSKLTDSLTIGILVLDL